MSLAPPSSIRPKRDPVTISHLRSLLHHLDFTDPFDVTIWAIACVSFWAQARLGEVTFDGDFDPSLHATRSGINLNRTDTGCKYGKIWVPRTKTKPQGDWLMFTDSGCACSALTILQAHLNINSSPPASAPLFAFETADKKFAPMRHSWFLNRCNEIWLLDQLSSLQGHVFCISGTTHLLLLGVDPFIVMVQGGWSSTAFLLYWRFCKEIIPMFIGFSLDSTNFPF